MRNRSPGGIYVTFRMNANYTIYTLYTSSVILLVLVPVIALSVDISIIRYSTITIRTVVRFNSYGLGILCGYGKCESSAVSGLAPGWR